MTLKIIIDVDDVRPENFAGLLGFKGPLGYLKKLNEEFGAKFTLFVPVNWHGKFHIKRKRGWLRNLAHTGFIEIASHGLLHQANDPKYKDMEYINVTDEEFKESILKQIVAFQDLGVDPKGYRPPGWAIKPSQYKIIARYFKYIADHHIGVLPIKTRDGLLRIPYTLSIDNLHSTHYNDGLLVLHSHITGMEGSNNCWNQETFEKVREFLHTLIEKNEKVEFITMSEIE